MAARLVTQRGLLLSTFNQQTSTSSLLHCIRRSSLFSRKSAEAIVCVRAAIQGISVAERTCRIHTQNHGLYQEVTSSGPAVPGLGSTFSFHTIKYPLTHKQYKILAIEGNKTMGVIMNETHALLRLTNRKDGEVFDNFGVMIGGSLEQIERAKTMLTESLPSGERSKLKDGEDGEGKMLWEGYVRNFKGQIPPKDTRKKCFIGKRVSTGNPCPICKHFHTSPNYELTSKVYYKDVKLLKQFISPLTGKIMDFKRTGLCQRRQKEVTEAIEKAKEYGLLKYTIPGPRDIPKPFKFAGVPHKVRHKT